MGLKNLNAYELIEEREITDLKSHGYILRHKKTGAKVLCIDNDDKNKVFYIGFRTPPVDSTGVPHIIEHSVLCGSKKYNVKDPFVELAKGSLNTFLNAMTYPDKTVYPVASCNDKDFANLTDVYLDAVFSPNIYRNEKIFKQEGWHYELESADDDITLNGVVYSEMKGVFSSPDDMLDRYVFNSLFPQTCYGVESGGDPDFIPELTYEGFLEFHKRYYHPSNSYIYLYGDMDFEERLSYIDEEYLSKYDYLEIDSSIKDQKPFSDVVKQVYEYPVTEDESIEDNTYLSYNTVIDTSLNRENYIAFQILDYALLSAPGAVLKQALLDRKIGKDIDSTFENGIKQPYFSIVSRCANDNQIDEFIACIREVLSDVVKNGIDRKALLAGLNVFEFRYREADFGQYPKGLMYGLQALDSWLYDESKPFLHIEELDTFDFLRKQVDTGYFEELISKYLLDNTHASVVVLSPKRGLLEKKEEELSQKLSQLKQSLSENELNELVQKTAKLKEYQQKEDSEEDLKCIPLLEISDIDKKAEDFVYKENEVEGKVVLTHDVFTNGIGYLNIAFSADKVPEDKLSYIGILKACLGQVNTKNHTYADLANDIFLNSGGIYPGGGTYTNVNDRNLYKNYFEFSAKVMYDKLGFAFDIIEEIIYTSDFSDKKRMREIICMIKSRLSQNMMSSGHSVAVMRASADLSPSGKINEYMSGIEFFRVIEALEADFDNKADELIENLRLVSKMIFNKESLELIDYTSESKELENIKMCSAKFIKGCPESDFATAKLNFERKQQSQVYTTSGQVCYAAKAGIYADENHKYNGALNVLKTILGYDYLWNNIRVLGGAYGAFSMFSRAGIAAFVSYRDPNLKKTLEIYDKAAGYLDGFTASDRDMTKYIIGTVSNLDIPLTPAAKGSRSRTAYIVGDTYENIQRERDEVLNATEKDIRKLSEYIANMLKEASVCVVGGQELVRKDGTEFEYNQSLFLN